jgi:3-(3-hydroxy-phenyl)propionate hydroxylase
MPIDFDAAIVGYGPVGATLANLLGLAGLRVGIFEREPSLHPQPRAGHFDGEVMRVFQTIGLAEKIQPNTFVSPGMRFVNVRGELLLDWPRPQEIGPDGWHASYRFHQPDLERSLREGVARFDGVEARLRCDVFALDEAADHVVLRYENLATGAIEKATARYVIGCDGARSVVRRFMGAPVEDLQSHERWLIVDLLLKQPRPDLPGVTVQYCDPARPLTMIRMYGERRRWEFMLMPGDDPAMMTRPERIWPLLSRWITPEEAEIERAIIYTFHSVLVRGWRVGHMLLAGDACHQTPPFMGQGMCAGIRDAANLAWKLAAVNRGESEATLLDSYEDERSPHVRQYIDTAVRLGGIIQATDPEIVARRDLDLAANPAMMASIKPRLGRGLHGDAPPPAGMLSKQPRLADGRRLDDAVGYRFALICRDGIAKGVSAETRARLRAAEFAILSDAGDKISTYLDELAAAAVIIRPDRYILGTANSAPELDALVARALCATDHSDGRALRTA